MFYREGTPRVQSSRGVPVGTVEFITNICIELWAFRGICIEEAVRELSPERQAGFGQGMKEGQEPRQREPHQLLLLPGSGLRCDGTWRRQ